MLVIATWESFWQGVKLAYLASIGVSLSLTVLFFLSSWACWNAVSQLVEEKGATTPGILVIAACGVFLAAGGICGILLSYVLIF